MPIINNTISQQQPQALGGYRQLRQLPRVHILNNQPISSPRFGNRFHAISRAIFQPVTESYLIGFTVQDVIGLWLPRIYNSLERGRIPYNPANDPDVNKRSSNEQRKHALQENIKGLNWWNGFEETAREVQSGPGYLLAQSIFIGAATAYWMGKRGLMMSVKNLDTYSSYLAKVLSNTPGNAMHQQPIITQLLQQMTSKLTENKTAELSVSAVLSPAEQKMLTKSELVLHNWLSKHYTQATPVSIYDALKTWQKDYIAVIDSPAKLAEKSKKLPALEKVFEEIVAQWNTTVKGVTSPTQMTLFELPGVPSIIPGKTIRNTIEARPFLLNLEKFTTLLPQVTDSLKKVKAGLKPSELAVTNILKNLRNTTVVNKFWLCTIATLLGGLNHFYVSYIAQSVSRKYPANRLIPLPQVPSVQHVQHPNTSMGGQNYA